MYGHGKLLGYTRCREYSRHIVSDRVILEWFVKIVYYSPIDLLR